MDIFAFVLYFVAMLAIGAYFFIKSKGVTEATLCSKYKLEKISDISMADYTKCVNGLQQMETINGA